MAEPVRVPVDWLLDADPWTAWATRRDILGEPVDAAVGRELSAAAAADERVCALTHAVVAWPWPVLRRHNDAQHPLHKLVFLCELGLPTILSELSVLGEAVLDEQERLDGGLGPPRVRINVPTRFGGSGADEWSWFLCDAPLLTLALVRLGYGDDERVQSSVRYLAGLVRDNGWPCSASPSMGRFRGPGRASDPCPYATLVMLRLLAAMPEWRESAEAIVGGQALLDLWDRRCEVRPYLFAMGTHFDRLKAPRIWYDILHVTDTLSRFPALRGDPRLGSMADLMAARVDPEGRVTPESVWMAWRGWCFGQKRSPSPWMTYLVHAMLKRMTG